MTVTGLRIVALCIWLVSAFLMFTTGWNMVGHILLTAVLVLRILVVHRDDGAAHRGVRAQVAPVRDQIDGVGRETGMLIYVREFPVR